MCLKKARVTLMMMMEELRSSNEDQVFISLDKKEEYIEKLVLILNQARKMLRDPEKEQDHYDAMKKVLSVKSLMNI